MFSGYSGNGSTEAEGPAKASSIWAVNDVDIKNVIGKFSR